MINDNDHIINQTKIKLFHWLFSLILTVVCGIILIGFGWTAFATITERPGLNGSMYSYYNLTRLQYSTYNILVSLAGLYIICCMTFYLFKKDKINLTKIFRQFLILIVLIVIGEIYLQTRLVGKG